VVRKPQVATREELLELIRQYFDKIGQIAVAFDAAELVNILKSVEIEVKRGQAPWPPPIGSPESMIYGAVTGWFHTLEPVPSEVRLLEEAFYSMACDYQLCWYIMWPLYRESTAIKDPFAPYFQLWIRGAGFRFTSKDLLTVYAPSLAP
jgi:hypothetical protein